ncbi:hypothetical protein EXN66_Car012177 [Channa argus]|uniref:Uncharacterized protein n=1 Tax=Channa argus TaxID=215402 RepID=A0A6G1Q208_CHAAH|nr:hypothetical protein EXN66_Car012177 [Channa argus]
MVGGGGGGGKKEGKLVKRGGREDPATPVIPALVYGHQWPARSQCSTTLLQCLVDSAEWEITHQELTFSIWGRRRREEEARSVGDERNRQVTNCVTLFISSCYLLERLGRIWRCYMANGFGY